MVLSADISPNVGNRIREQMYTIVLNGDISITTRGYASSEKEGHTIIPDSMGKPVFMTETRHIKSLSSVNMPLFS